MVNPSADKIRSPKNKTITLSNAELDVLKKRYIQVHNPVSLKEIQDKTINGDTFQILHLLPDAFADLIFVDPPYNLDKNFNSGSFKKMEHAEYVAWLDQWVSKLVLLLKPTASLYFCCDWQSSPALFSVLSKYFQIQNRITWEREKGRGAKSNWKNCSEDIWFCTMSKDYFFDVEAVKSKRKVIAPYKDESGVPKDWEHEENGKYRLTHPSNLWNDITIPFWSMPENTDHPTQKPEKLVAKAILASSKPGQVVFDPFLGSGTTSVVAKKLNRHYVGIELDEYYACATEKRLELAGRDNTIQGYSDGVFWERNTGAEQNGNGNTEKTNVIDFHDKQGLAYVKQKSLFPNFLRV